MVCPDALGPGRFYSLHDRGHRGIEPLAFRSSGRRVRDYCRLLHRVFRLEVRALFPGRIHWHVRYQRPGYHALSGRLAGAVCVFDLGALVRLVFWQAAGPDCRFHLGARHAAPPAHGPAHELRLEVHAPDGLGQPRRRRALALPGPRFFALGGLLTPGARSLRPARSWVVPGPAPREANLSVCRIKSQVTQLLSYMRPRALVNEVTR